MTDEEDASRRAEELEALRAFYGDDRVVVMDTSVDDATESTKNRSLEATTWKITLRHPDVILQLFMPRHYPSRCCPIPNLLAPSFVIDPDRQRDLAQELQSDLWDKDNPSEVAILWTEHCKAALSLNDEVAQDDQGTAGGDTNRQETNQENSVPDSITDHDTSVDESTRTYYPPTSKYGQATRSFDTSVIHNDELYRQRIYCSKPFHPPKSGQGETMIAHVAQVTNMQHVQWVLAKLLFGDKKVAKATHNMFAYRFVDSDASSAQRTIVSDNDDDGEKGSGTKLAALLEMSKTINVIVVVSRWFGGVKLGSSRFKYIAQVARQALEEHGFIGNEA